MFKISNIHLFSWAIHLLIPKTPGKRELFAHPLSYQTIREGCSTKNWEIINSSGKASRFSQNWWRLHVSVQFNETTQSTISRARHHFSLSQPSEMHLLILCCSTELAWHRMLFMFHSRLLPLLRSFLLLVSFSKNHKWKCNILQRLSFFQIKHVPVCRVGTHLQVYKSCRWNWRHLYSLWKILVDLNILCHPSPDCGLSPSVGTRYTRGFFQ